MIERYPEEAFPMLVIFPQTHLKHIFVTDIKHYEDGGRELDYWCMENVGIDMLTEDEQTGEIILNRSGNWTFYLDKGKLVFLFKEQNDAVMFRLANF
jgi:hypothetical protein